MIHTHIYIYISIYRGRFVTRGGGLIIKEEELQQLSVHQDPPLTTLQEVYVDPFGYTGYLGLSAFFGFQICLAECRHPTGVYFLQMSECSEVIGSPTTEEAELNIGNNVRRLAGSTSL